MTVNGPVVVIGLGNEYRRDDAAGVLVARRLAARRLPGVRFDEEQGEGLRLLDLWRGAAVAVLVDSMRSGAAPGTVRVLDAGAGELPAGAFGLSTHRFELGHLVELGRLQGELPGRLLVVGIEGRDFGIGRGLSAAVEGALDVAASAVEEAIAFCGGASTPGGTVTP